ncbi:hypothetical protein SADUNF_Sadunf03G0119800 [Salix dunnii]|uniref:DNA helicase n=1 Tax=Salix dunnii TaxID=1413687 RepID=A0A835N4E6_9ROSI|nr:hypothetical protein SADUNF_Sadunf03G0119800 [Salix dunnii]
MDIRDQSIWISRLQFMRPWNSINKHHTRWDACNTQCLNFNSSCRGDTTLGSRVAYRMAVRQLEALIRLSEAIARSHSETQVHKGMFAWQ